MITLIVLLYLSMAIYISFSEMKENKPIEALKTGFSMPLLLFIVMAGLVGMLFLGGILLIGLFAGGAWIYIHMP